MAATNSTAYPTAPVDSAQQARIDRARAGGLAKWENRRLKKQLEMMNGSAALLLGKINEKDAKLLAKWPNILDIIRVEAVDKKQPWAIKMFKEIKDDFVKRATQELENKRDTRRPQVSVSIQNALIQMPVKLTDVESKAPESTLSATAGDLSASQEIIDLPHTPSGK